MKASHCSFKPLIDHTCAIAPLDWRQVYEKDQPLVLEIGFGLGEVLFQKALHESHCNYLGVEEHWERVCKTLRTLQKEEERTSHVKIIKADVRTVLAKYMRPQVLDDVYCLFPCPWPKKGHVRHRLFSNKFLRLLNSRMKEETQVRIVTDDHDYYEWICEELPATGFEFKKRTINPQFNTKFEKKWCEAGQQQFYELILNKTQHIDVPIWNDVKMKRYKVKEFKPEKFQMQNTKGDITVIFKNYFYDPKKETAIVHVVISEQHLNQNVRISIIHKNNQWNIGITEGQNFFATEGVALAVKSVYEACLN